VRHPRGGAVLKIVPKEPLRLLIEQINLSVTRETEESEEETEDEKGRRQTQLLESA
jgi:hypothetical protein